MQLESKANILFTIQLSLRMLLRPVNAFFFKTANNMQRPGGPALRRNANLWKLRAGYILERGPKHSHLERPATL